MAPYKATLIAALIILVALAGCKTHHQQIIVVDGWWTYDYARNTCSRIAQVTPCIQDSEQMAFQLEKDFASRFQENPSCSNLQLFRGFRDPKTTDAKTSEILLNADWTIQFNIAVQDGVPNRTDSTWQISSSKGSFRYADGGLKNFYEAAGQVCRMVKGEGGQELPTPE